jgi:membrane-bound ClpP family serine protease
MSDPNTQPDGAQNPYPGAPYDAANPYPGPPFSAYPQAPGGYGYQPQATRNGMAIAALVLGIIGLVTSIVFIGGALGIVGLILGIVSLRTSKRTGAGKGMAIGGIVTSILAIVATIALIIASVWLVNKAQNCSQYSSDSTQYSQCIQQQISGTN